MKFEDLEIFELEMTNDSIPYEKIDQNDERLGYAIGWLYNEFSLRNPHLKIVSLTKRIDFADQLRKFMLKTYKEVNGKILVSDRTITKLLGFVIEGLLLKEGQKINSGIQGCVLQGLSAPVTTSIKRARQRAGLSQKELSELLEVPKRTIENWDNGSRKPPKWVEKLIIEKLERIQDEN